LSFILPAREENWGRGGGAQEETERKTRRRGECEWTFCHPHQRKGERLVKGVVTRDTEI